MMAGMMGEGSSRATALHYASMLNTLAGLDKGLMNLSQSLGTLKQCLELLLGIKVRNELLH
jgi:hypothetical protein